MKVTLYPAITLDGFIADLNGECYSWISDEDEEHFTKVIARAGCVLLGRRTYEQYPEDFPPKSGATAFVWTTRTDQQDQERVIFVRGTPQEVLGQIAGHGFSELIVSGGGEVNGALAEADLVDEIIVSIYNVTIGEGIPLFGSHKPKLKLDLLSTTNEIDGIVKNHYKIIHMDTLSEQDLKAAHAHAWQHRSEILQSNICGCFHCTETFKPSEIDEWVDEGTCAVCPRCGIDAVIGDASGYDVESQAFLGQMRKYWFER